MMKKLLLVAVAVMAITSLTACMGERGYEGSAKVCKNETFLGISLIEVFSPCTR